MECTLSTSPVWWGGPLINTGNDILNGCGKGKGKKQARKNAEHELGVICSGTVDFWLFFFLFVTIVF